jgi:hypothetical protein
MNHFSTMWWLHLGVWLHWTGISSSFMKHGFKRPVSGQVKMHFGSCGHKEPASIFATFVVFINLSWYYHTMWYGLMQLRVFVLPDPFPLPHLWAKMWCIFLVGQNKPAFILRSGFIEQFLDSICQSIWSKSACDHLKVILEGTNNVPQYHQTLHEFWGILSNRWSSSWWTEKVVVRRVCFIFFCGPLSP